MRQAANDRLFNAAYYNDQDLARQALTDGADPLAKSVDEGDWTPLDIARFNSNREVADILEKALAARKRH